MAKRRRHIPYIRSKHRLPQTRSTFILLDQFSVADIQKWTAFKDQLLKYHWDYYSELAYQRSQIADGIKKSLLEATQKTFSFEKWQRTVRYKYALRPFSTTGSITDPTGGRFNVVEKVSFKAADHEGKIGTLMKYNKKTVTVITEDGGHWNVSPHLLSKVSDNDFNRISAKEHNLN